MNIPTLEELINMKENWLVESQEYGRKALRIGAVLGEPIVIHTWNAQRIQLDGWQITYTTRDLEYNLRRKDFDKKESVVIEDSTKRVWMRFVVINGRLQDQESHIVPGDWRDSINKLHLLMEKRLQEIQTKSDEEERQRLARLLLVI